MVLSTCLIREGGSYSIIYDDPQIMWFSALVNEL